MDLTQLESLFLQWFPDKQRCSALNPSTPLKKSFLLQKSLNYPKIQFDKENIKKCIQISKHPDTHGCFSSVGLIKLLVLKYRQCVLFCFFTVDSNCVARGRNIWSWRRSTGKCSKRRKPSIPGWTERDRNIPAQLEPPLCSGTQGTLWPAPSSRMSLCPVENLLQRYIYKRPGVLHL